MSALSFLEIISIITAFQLLMLGFVLLAKRNRISNLVLSFYMFANALLLIWFIINLLDVANLGSIPFLYYLLGPLIYLYVRSLTEKDFKLSGRLLIHGIIFIVSILYSIAKELVPSRMAFSDWNFWEYLVTQFLLHTQIVAYIVASFAKITSYRRTIKEHFSSVARIDLSWLLLIIMAFTLMWLIDLTTFILNITQTQTPLIIHTLLILSILINFIFASLVVYKGLQHAEAFSGLKVPEKYSGSKMSDDETEVIVRKLQSLMQQTKPYLNPDLTIKDLSEQMQIHRKQLSQVINSQFGQNFYDFVNQYRVQEAKEIITGNSDSKKTILEVLYEVGFNSKSAFNNAFKKNTGKTPSEFKRPAS